MSYLKPIALITILIFLSALGGDSVAATITPSTVKNTPINTTKPADKNAPVAAKPTTTPAASAAAPVAHKTVPNLAPASTASSTATTPSTSSATPAAPTETRPVVGKVIWVKGIFSALSPDKKTRPLIKGQAIYLHDTLITDPKSQAGIVFTDDTLMTFRESTKFYIDQYEFHPEVKKGSVGKYITNLITGGFRTITGLIAKANPPDYHVKTPVATIGVRGTDYTVVLQNGELTMGLDHGTPCLSSAGGDLCLGNITRYAQVKNAKAKPVPLTQAPEVFKAPLDIQNVTYTPPTIADTPGVLSSDVKTTTGEGSTTTEGSSSNEGTTDVSGVSSSDEASSTSTSSDETSSESSAENSTEPTDESTETSNADNDTSAESSDQTTQDASSSSSSSSSSNSSSSSSSNDVTTTGSTSSSGSTTITAPSSSNSSTNSISSGNFCIQ